MVAPTTPLPRLANEFHALSRWEYRPNLALRHDPIVYEAASLTRPRKRPGLNRPVRKTGRSLDSRRGLRKARHPRQG